MNESGSSTAIGLDVGGTKVRAILLSDEHAILADCRLETERGPDGVVDTAQRAVFELTDMAGIPVDSVGSIGIGVPGLVDAEAGRVVHAVNLGIDGDGVDLADMIAERTGVRAVGVENDVNVGAVGAADVFAVDGSLGYLSIGTGLAAGIVQGGHVLRGAKLAAGEIGHLPIDAEGAACNCGQRGCLETVASGSAIGRMWPTSHGHAPEALFAAAAAGDADAVACRTRFLGAVALCIQILAVTVDPDAYVLGGGVCGVGDPLLTGVREALGRQAATSPFVASLDLAARVDMIAVDSPVAAIGAALIGRGVSVPVPLSRPRPMARPAVEASSAPHARRLR